MIFGCILPLYLIQRLKKIISYAKVTTDFALRNPVMFFTS